MDEGDDRLVLKLQAEIAELRKRADDLAREVVERKKAEKRAEETIALAHRTGQALLLKLEQHERIERALRESEERHRLLADNASDVIWTMNLEGRLTYISPSVQKLRGFTVAEALNETIAEALTEPSAALGEARFREALEDVRAGRPFPQSRAEVEHRRKDGSTVWTEVTTSGMVDGSGRLVGILGVTRDITERRRLMAELEEERARLVQAQEVARVGSWATELKDLRVVWSEQTHRIFETDAASFEVTHPEFLSRIHPGDRDAVNAAFAGSLQTTGPNSIEHRIVMADGRIKHVEERWHVIRNARGEPVRALGTCQDITEAREAAQRMASQLEELRRWQATMLGREERNLELKREVNALARRLGEPIPYPSQEDPARS